MIILCPFAVPIGVPGLAVDAWTIAQPLLLLVFLPLVFGMLLLRTFPRIAKQVRPRLATSQASQPLSCSYFAPSSTDKASLTHWEHGLPRRSYCSSQSLPPRPMSAASVCLVTVAAC